MNFIQQLHERALEAAKRFKKAESDLIDIFQEFDKTKGFIQFKHASLFEYGVKALKLSEANTYAFIQVARKSREVPALKEAIQNGEITLSKANRIASVITTENQEDWLTKAKNFSKSGLEKEIARINPEHAVSERARYVSETRLELKVGVSEELMKELKRSQDLLSQRMKSAATLEEALKEMAALYLEKNDPVRKASRTRAQLCPGRVNLSKRSRIVAPTKHALNLRDQGRCIHVAEDGVRCTQRRWLQIHHKKPVSEGGQNNLSNLATLCFQHHQLVHRSG